MPRTIFNPVLFWDAGDIDLEKHADYVIARILDYGDERDLKALRRIYSDENNPCSENKKRSVTPHAALLESLFPHTAGGNNMFEDVVSPETS